MRASLGLLLATFVFAGCTDASSPGPGPDPDPDPDPPALGPAWGKPISGGTILVTHDGARVLVADPDRDRVSSIDTTTHALAFELALEAGDEPGRVIEDAAGRIHVALRRGGAVVTLASANGPLLERRAVCAEPRGLAYDAAGDVVHVACKGGELVDLPAAGGAATRTLHLDRDLRDVAMVGGKLMLTRMKTAEVLTLDGAGTVTERLRSPDVQRQFFTPELGQLQTVPSQALVAWRAVAMPDGSGLVVAHQRARLSPLSTEQGGYGGDMCGGGGSTEPTLTLFTPGAEPVASRPLSFTALPVDVAVAPDGQRLALAMAGDETVRIVGSRMLTDGDEDPCQDPPEENIIFDSSGIPSSVAFMPNTGDLIVYYPDHNTVRAYALPYDGTQRWTVSLPGARGYDVGRAIFHRMTFANLACATCHPEGQEDGHVWEFAKIGPRRTQQIGGHILSRAPYHWDGDMTDLSRLMNEVFVGRMGGQLQGAWEVEALGKWMDTIQAPAASSSAPSAAIARGRALFESAEVGCIGCHAGSSYTNNQRFDVGTGGVFKVPSLLGIGARAPFIHNGCAATLRDRFTCGGGDKHGNTTTLSEGQIGDLVAFLETL
jgi:DNA-binding beta-propeller fold protein YncE